MITAQYSVWQRPDRICGICEKPIIGQVDILTSCDILIDKQWRMAHMLCVDPNPLPHSLPAFPWVYAMLLRCDPERATYFYAKEIQP